MQNRNIVGDGVRKLAYDIPERNFSAFLSQYHKSILRQTYDNPMTNRKIFCKSGLTFFLHLKTLKTSVLETTQSIRRE